MVNHFHPAPVICIAVGTAFGYYCLGSLAPAAIIIVMFTAVAALSFFRVLASLDPKSRQFRLMEIYSAVFAAGLSIGICAQTASVNNVRFGITEDKITAVNGVLLEDPRIISGGRAMAALSLRKAAGAGGLRASSGGEMTVFFPEDSAIKIREFGRGTEIFAEGSVYSGEKGWTFSAKSMHITKQAPPIEKMRTGIRLNLIQRFSKNFADGNSFTNANAGGLALAMLIGIKDNLDTDLSAMYRKAGLSYVLALSGMHLAVLVSFIAFLLRKLLGIKAAAIAGAVIIVVYCFIVGPMPSLNRAALMYFLGVLAVLGTLPKESIYVLSLSFLIQIIVTPSSGNSISFILSYLAMLGILFIGKPLASLFTGKVPDFLTQPLAVSCGAFLATAGVTCFAFGVLAPAGIITGLVVVPAATVFMIGSIVWLVLDTVSLSGIINMPLYLVYQFTEKTVFFAGRIPYFSVSKPFSILMLSLVLSLAVIFLEHRSRERRLTLQPFLD
ncbi:MAG: ComEC/Rec2 family competence protein [Spirochaetes bacterium]|nr:ComEC/Rec2 family competence protein [Spirochaetota bacterium]